MGLDAGTDQAWKAELGVAVWVSSDGLGRLERELERSLRVIPQVRSSVVCVQVKNWSKPQDAWLATVRLIVPSQPPYQQPRQL